MSDARYDDRGQMHEPRPPAYPAGGPGSRSEMMTGSTSVSQLFQGIVGGVERIIRSEVRLAKAEVTGEVRVAGRSAGMLAAAGVLALLAAQIILMGVVYLLAKILPQWLAAILVGVIVAATAGILGKTGYERIRSVNPKPEQTIDSIKEDVQWVRQQSR